MRMSKKMVGRERLKVQFAALIHVCLLSLHIRGVAAVTLTPSSTSISRPTSEVARRLTTTSVPNRNMQSSAALTTAAVSTSSTRLKPTTTTSLLLKTLTTTVTVTSRPTSTVTSRSTIRSPVTVAAVTTRERVRETSKAQVTTGTVAISTSSVKPLTSISKHASTLVDMKLTTERPAAKKTSEALSLLTSNSPIGNITALNENLNITASDGIYLIVCNRTENSSTICPPTVTTTTTKSTTRGVPLIPSSTTEFPLALAIGVGVGGGVALILLTIICAVCCFICRRNRNSEARRGSGKQRGKQSKLPPSAQNCDRPIRRYVPSAQSPGAGGDRRGSRPKHAKDVFDVEIRPQDADFYPTGNGNGKPTGKQSRKKSAADARCLRGRPPELQESYFREDSYAGESQPGNSQSHQPPSNQSVGSSMDPFWSGDAVLLTPVSPVRSSETFKPFGNVDSTWLQDGSQSSLHTPLSGATNSVSIY